MDLPLPSHRDWTPHWRGHGRIGPAPSWISILGQRREELLGHCSLRRPAGRGDGVGGTFPSPEALGDHVQLENRRGEYNVGIFCIGGYQRGEAWRQFASELD